MAARAQETFRQLRPEDINLALGMFGDLGFTQRELTSLAILAQQGRLQPDPQWSRRTLQAYGRRQLQRNRERIARFAQRETIQGAGLGWPEFLTGEPTERAQRVLMELLTPAGGEAMLRERLAELLPPEFDIDQAVRLIKLFQTPEALERGRRGAIPLRPLTALMERIGLVEPRHAIALEDQPGLINQMLEAMGLTKEFEEIRVSEYEELQAAFRRILREGAPGGGRGPVGTAAQQPVIIHNDYRNGYWVYPDGATQRAARRGPEYERMVAER